MNTPDAITRILSQILDYSRTSSAANIDFGVSYVSPHYYATNFMLSVVSAYVSSSGLSRGLILDFLIILLSDGMIPFPDGISRTDYQSFVQYFYRRIYEQMANISGNFHYAAALSLINQQINEGKRVIIFAHSAGA